MTAYFDRPSPVHALDPRVKIAWSVAVSLLAVVLRQPLMLGGLFALTIAPWCLVRPPLARCAYCSYWLGRRCSAP